MYTTIAAFFMFLSIMCSEVVSVESNRYCSFTPQARDMMHEWMEARGLGHFFKKENVTVITNLLVASRSVSITMKIPVQEWSAHRRRFLQNSARMIVTNTALGVYGGALFGLIGANCAISDCGWGSRIRSAVCGAATGGIFSFLCIRDYVLRNAEIVRVPDASTQDSATVLVQLNGLVEYIKSKSLHGDIELTETSAHDEHALTYVLREKSCCSL